MKLISQDIKEGEKLPLRHTAYCWCRLMSAPDANNKPH